MFRIQTLVRRFGLRRTQSAFGAHHSFHQTSTLRTTDSSLYSELLEDTQRNSDNQAARVPKRRSTRKAVFKSGTDESKDADTGAKAKPRRVKATGEKSKTDSTAATDNAEIVPKKRRARSSVKLEAGQQKKPRAVTKTSRKRRAQEVPESLKEDPWKDIQEYLNVCYGNNPGSTAIGDNRRINVISEALCDDVLERLEPTLEKHVGCDIIDINPGTCLWSSKLHSRLRPRKHILLEPDVELYRPFIQPLMDETDSKYEWIPKSGVVWGHLEPVLTKEHLPFQEAYDTGDPRLEQPNDTLLVIASIGYFPKKRFRGFPSLASLVLYQFMSAIRTHSLFEKYGHVRILVWAADEERRFLLPKELFKRRKFTVESEISCESITEVASSTNDPALLRQDRQLDLEKAQSVLQSMEAAGIRTPPGRESLLLQELLIDSEDKTAVTHEAALTHDYVLAELKVLRARFAAGKFNMHTEEVKEKGVDRIHPDYKRMAYLQGLHTRRQRTKDQWAALVSIHDELTAAETALHAAKAAGTTTEKEKEALRQVRQDWDAALDEFPNEQAAIQARYICDARRAFKQDPPLLLWHKRKTEPLLVRPEEFFPNNEMCLLDFHPQSLWRVLRPHGGNAYDDFEFIVSHIFMLPSQSIKRALKSLYPGAYEWIYDNCPALRDPTKGGAPDLDTMVVRCITLDHLQEIVEAWVKWPFKPTKMELLASMGSNIYAEDVVDVKGDAFI